MILISEGQKLQNHYSHTTKPYWRNMFLAATFSWTHVFLW